LEKRRSIAENEEEKEMEFVRGIGLLFLVLAIFSVFSMKAPKGNRAMNGLAGAAVATYLIEAVHGYISGEFFHMAFLGEVGTVAGGMGGSIAAILVGVNMGVNPVFAAVAGAAVGGLGILPGFLAGYAIGLIGHKLEKWIPDGLDLILGALIIAPVARAIASFSTPLVDSTLLSVGDAIVMAADQSPLVMGFLLGGIIKVMCTSPLSSMALTAILGLQGLAMGIASIACVGGAFTNGIILKRMGFGDSSNIIAVMLEPLTQADLVAENPLPIYLSSFIGGGFSGIAAAKLGIINNAPGTASTIPGLLAPFAFNSAQDVFLALAFAAVGGIAGGYVTDYIFRGAAILKAERNRFSMAK